MAHGLEWTRAGSRQGRFRRQSDRIAEILAGAVTSLLRGAACSWRDGPLSRSHRSEVSSRGHAVDMAGWAVGNDRWEQCVVGGMERALDPPLILTGGRDSEYQPEAASFDAAFAALYETEYRGMIRLAFVMLDSQEQAEDVVHDALARVIERWDRIDNPGAYLRATVLNGARSVLRRRRLIRRHQASEFESTDPEADYLTDLLAILTPTRRAVIVLRYFEQLTVPEIARTLGIREGTVKSSLHRGLRTLRQEFKP